uniref:Transposase (Putative), gypsy type n=1 Tax=Tanacetum cinerariifolium TaxID=118510 RepID=A0A6L2MNW2_TANCI|nr:hypothetical protein [Tanacetum cinerariifolium]
MSGSEPGGMALEGSKAVVLPKFNTHIYTFEMTLEKLKTTINEYCIPMDLHPRLPPPGMTMDRLPSRYIGLYVEQLEHGGLRVSFSSFSLMHQTDRLFVLGFYKLCKQGHWFSFENKTEGRAKKCFKEVTTSLKGWKRKFFLLDRRAVSDAMPRRHGDTNLHYEFPNNYEEGKAARMSEFLVPLRPPPHHLLYVCGLTTACRHSELRYDIKDQDINGTVVSRGDPIPGDQRPKPRAKAKRAGAGGEEGSKKRRKVWKNDQSIQSGFKATLSAIPLHQASPKVGKKPAAAASPEIAKDTPRSSHHGHEDESVANRYVPDWELCNDLRVCTFIACKELVSHLDTLDKDEFLGSLSNVEVISRAYQTLGQSVVAQGELLKWYKQLNHNYVDLQNRNDAQLEELDHLSFDLRRMSQENEGLNQRHTLLDSAHSVCLPREKELLDRVKDLEWERDEWRNTTSDQVEKIQSLEKDLKPRTQQLVVAEEKVEVLEGEKLDLVGKVARAEADHKKLVHEFLPAMVKRLQISVATKDQIAQLLSETQDLDIEGLKSWQAKHQEIFIMSYPYVQKVANSCDLPMNELLSVYPDVLLLP